MNFPFARRTNWHQETNTLNKALEELGIRGIDILDLTVSNPTSCGFSYPERALSVLSSVNNFNYHPDARGVSEARQAVFERAVALQALAVEVAEARRRAILSGTEQEIADRYMELHGRLREELERLGPDHSHYADLHRKRLTRRLRASLEDEGRIRPPAAGRD